MKSNYKTLGNYIRKVDNRNRDLKATKLLGINIDKFFMPSVANVNGTDMSTYKVVKKDQFACNRMHVGRDYRLPVALSRSENDFIVSPAYDVFEIIDTEELLPEYLMMWFSRKEFDRNAWFYTDADVRGGLNWNALVDMQLPIPCIEKQQEIVKEYHAIINRIALNNLLIKKLEETAQAIYNQWFVEFEFTDAEGKAYKSNGGEMEFSEKLKIEIPKGWMVKPFTKVLKLNGGGTPNTNEDSYWNGNIPFFTPADVSSACYSITTEKYISERGLNNCSSKLYPKDTVFVTARGTVGAIALAGCEMAMNQSCYAIIDTRNSAQYYAHQLTKHSLEKLKNEASGAVFNALVTKDFEGQSIIGADDLTIIKFDQTVKCLYDLILITYKENLKLSEFKELLLSKLATIEDSVLEEDFVTTEN